MEEAAARPARTNDGDVFGGPKASTMSQGGFEIVTRGSKRCARGKGHVLRRAQMGAWRVHCFSGVHLGRVSPPDWI